jgi:HlyD family secretion protein
MKKILVAAVVVVLLAGGAGYWFWRARAASQTTFRFAEVKRGRLRATVGSTGTLQPSELVDVGAQVAGPIIAIGTDDKTQSKRIDWGSEVQGPLLDKDGNVLKKGTVLAQIDPALYKAQVGSAEAAVLSAKADLKQKEAALKSAKATLNQATADWERAKSLYPGGIAKAEYDQFQAAFEVAGANVEVATANVAVSSANIATAQANLKTAQTNLNYTTITAPVDGTVIDRRVNVGQTVVASLSAPSLFLIAKNLDKMEVWATVNEVDVGKIQAGQDVRFTVDAIPGKIYKGKVVPQGRLPFRLNATMNQNVVTYTVVVSADNKDHIFRPYLTANVTFIVADRKNALLVPNAALRWQPSAKQIAPDVRDTYYQLKGKKRSAADSDTEEHGFVWVQGEDGYLRYIELQLGLSDTVNTEVLGVVGGGNLPEHTQLIVGEGRADAVSNGSNPFSVQLFKPKTTNKQ